MGCIGSRSGPLERWIMRMSDEPACQSPVPTREGPLRLDLNLGALINTCEIFPVALALPRRTMVFARVSRAMCRQAAFLAQGSLRLGKTRFEINVDDLLLDDAVNPRCLAPRHFIFISAFCCSTLLARYLDTCPGCLVLREPGVLGQLGVIQSRGSVASRATWRWSTAEWEAWTRLALNMLARTSGQDQVVIIKAADVCNQMALYMMTLDHRSRAVFLSVGLRTFILSVLKSSSRREWTRSRANYWRFHMRAVAGLGSVHPSTLDDGKRAAYLWAVTRHLWSEAAARLPSGRFAFMDGESVARAPRVPMKRLEALFGLPAGARSMDPEGAHHLRAKHAKSERVKYSAERRASDLALWRNRFGRETEAAVEWCQERFGVGDPDCAVGCS